MKPVTLMVLLLSNGDCGLFEVLLNVLFVTLPLFVLFPSMFPFPWNGKKLRMSFLPPADAETPETNAECLKITHTRKHRR
jgi:hypothetical protein